MYPRRTILTAVAACLLVPSAAYAQPEKVPVNLKGVRGLKGLVKAMKEAAGDRAPAQIDHGEVNRALAEAFLDNAPEAMAKGIRMPARVRRFLPERRVSPTSQSFLPAFVVVPLWGMHFVFELAPFYFLLVGAIAGLMMSIREKASEQQRVK